MSAFPSIAQILVQPKVTGVELLSSEADPLDPVQEAAVDLYLRGLNVFPVPEPHEVEAWAAKMTGGRDRTSKPPYLLRPLFTSRLHMCDEQCLERQRKGRKPCLPPGARFDALFRGANLAVMTGRTSGNLVGVDCDSPEAFEMVLCGLDQRGISHWSYETARGGGILLRLAEGEAENAPRPKTPINDVEIWGHRHYMILPPSVHWSGVRYAWITPPGPRGEPPPLVSVRDLDWLGITPVRRARQRGESRDLGGLPEWPAALRDLNRDVLLQGAAAGERNNRLFAAACDMAGNEVPYDDARQAIIAAAQRCIPPLAVDEALASLESAYSKVREPACKAKKAGSPPDWEKARAFADRHVWTGPTAQSDRASFLAACRRAELERRVPFRASEREIAELANAKRPTARAAMHRLSHQANSVSTPHLLEFAGTDPASGANLYRFTELALHSPPYREHARTHGPHYSPLEPSGYLMRGLKPIDNPLTPAEQDVFGRLGRISWRVWQYLLQVSAPSGAAIARSAGLKAGSVTRVLKRLEGFGLATRNSADGHWQGVAKSEEELECLAVELGVSGRAAKRKREHVRDRELIVNKKLAAKRRLWRKRLWRHEQERCTEWQVPDQAFQEKAMAAKTCGEGMVAFSQAHNLAGVPQANNPQLSHRMLGADIQAAPHESVEWVQRSSPDHTQSWRLLIHDQTAE